MLSSASGPSSQTVGPPETAPDLADMREQRPELEPLWDAIRHEYWSRFPALHDNEDRPPKGRI